MQEKQRAEGLREFCDSIDVSYDSGFRAYKSGNLRAFRVGKNILVPFDEIERVLREGLEVRCGRPPKAKPPAGANGGGAAAEARP